MQLLLLFSFLSFLCSKEGSVHGNKSSLAPIPSLICVVGAATRSKSFLKCFPSFQDRLLGGCKKTFHFREHGKYCTLLSYDPMGLRSTAARPFISKGSSMYAFFAVKSCTLLMSALPIVDLLLAEELALEAAKVLPRRHRDMNVCRKLSLSDV